MLVSGRRPRPKVPVAQLDDLVRALHAQIREELLFALDDGHELMRVNFFRIDTQLLVGLRRLPVSDGSELFAVNPFRIDAHGFIGLRPLPVDLLYLTLRFCRLELVFLPCGVV